MLRILLFIIFLFISFNIYGEDSRFRFLQSIDSKVEKLKNETTSIDATLDSNLTNEASALEIHYILTNNLGFNLNKSDVETKGLGSVVSFESDAYGLSYLFGNKNINLQIGLSIIGETKIKEFSDSDGNYTNQFSISSSKYRDYSINVGLGINENAELIIGYKSYQLEFDLIGSSTNHFVIDYNTRMIGIGVIF